MLHRLGWVSSTRLVRSRYRPSRDRALPQLVAIEAIAERSAVCGDLDHGQAPGDAGLIARGAEFHQQLFARQLHRRQLLERAPIAASTGAAESPALWQHGRGFGPKT